MTARTHFCEIGKHGNCAHRIGGPQESGVWFPECYVEFPDPSNRNRRVVMPAAWPGQAYAMVVSPSHRWRCGCDCHQAGQLPMFGVAS